MSYTKGPWVIGQTAHTCEEALVSASGSAVAYAAWDGGSGCHLAIKNPDDARLIAAAPELLEALRTKRDYVADAASGSLTYADSGDGFIAMAKEDLARIDAAIAKATGAGA